MENGNFDFHFDFLLPALLCYWTELDVTDFTSSLSQPEISPSSFLRDEWLRVRWGSFKFYVPCFSFLESCIKPSTQSSSRRMLPQSYWKAFFFLQPETTHPFSEINSASLWALYMLFGLLSTLYPKFVNIFIDCFLNWKMTLSIMSPVI